MLIGRHHHHHHRNDHRRHPDHRSITIVIMILSNLQTLAKYSRTGTELECISSSSKQRLSPDLQTQSAETNPQLLLMSYRL